MKEITLQVSGMTCNHCVMAVKKELSKLKLEKFDVEIGNVKAIYDESLVSENQIQKAIEEAGYKVIK